VIYLINEKGDENMKVARFKFIIVTGIVLIMLMLAGCTGTNADTNTTTSLFQGSTSGLVFDNTGHEGEFAVVSYLGNSENVIIGSTYYGYPVTSISADVFSNAEVTVTKITLPDSIVMIEAGAFASAEFEEFTVPVSLTYFAQAFGAYRGDVSIKLAESHPTLKEVTIGGHKAIVNLDETELMFVFDTSLPDETFTIPDTYVEIAPYAFSGTSYMKVVVPSSVSTIGTFAFSGMECEEIDLPDSLEVIETATFIDTPDAVINIPVNVKTIGAYAFCNSGFTGELVLPEGVETVGEGAFNANRLTSIVLPSTLTNLAPGFFANDGALLEHANCVTRITFNSIGFTMNAYSMRFYLQQFIYLNYAGQGYWQSCDDDVQITIVLPVEYQDAFSLERSFTYAWNTEFNFGYSYTDFLYRGFSTESFIYAYEGDQ